MKLKVAPCPRHREARVFQFGPFDDSGGNWYWVGCSTSSECWQGPKSMDRTEAIKMWNYIQEGYSKGRKDGARHVKMEVIKAAYKPGPICRDCADENGTCPSTGKPCDPYEAALDRLRREC